MKKKFEYNDLFDADMANAKFAKKRREIPIFVLKKIFIFSVLFKGLPFSK